MYSSSLRIDEVCHLPYKDTDRICMRAISFIRKANRNVIPSWRNMCLISLHGIGLSADPQEQLFPKQADPDRPSDTFFLSRHIHEHEDRPAWQRRITCHSFQHTLGIHLYENSTDLLAIKAILGHKSLNSTIIYVHLASSAISRVVNPLDWMGDVSHE